MHKHLWENTKRMELENPFKLLTANWISKSRLKIEKCRKHPIMLTELFRYQLHILAELFSSDLYSWFVLGFFCLFVLLFLCHAQPSFLIPTPFSFSLQPVHIWTNVPRYMSVLLPYCCNPFLRYNIASQFYSIIYCRGKRRFCLLCFL